MEVELKTHPFPIPRIEGEIDLVTGFHGIEQRKRKIDLREEAWQTPLNQMLKVNSTVVFRGCPPALP